MNKQEYQKKLRNYGMFKEYFRMPKILWDDKKNLLVEDFIDYTEIWTDEDVNNVVNDIIQNYMQYFKICPEIMNFNYYL